MLRQATLTLTKSTLRSRPVSLQNLERRCYSVPKPQETPKAKQDDQSTILPSSSSNSTKDTSVSNPDTKTVTNSATTADTEEETVKKEGTGETYEEREKRMKKNEIGYAFGANHWNLERASAVALIPLISTQFVYGAHPVVDGLLGVVLPYHIYMGFDSCITDYIPKRVYPRGYKAAMLGLKASFALTMWGCYEFNTNDIGITEAIQRIWTS